MESHCVYKSDDCKICRKYTPLEIAAGAIKNNEKYFEIPMNQPTVNKYEDIVNDIVLEICIDENCIERSEHEYHRDVVKERVMHLLSQQRKEIVELAESMKYAEHKHGTDCKDFYDCEKFSFAERIRNGAIDDIITKLSSEK